MLKQMFDQVREKSPLIHNITNYVTVNDCANMVLACGASPIMADDKEEVAEIQTICAGLNINIGTLNSRTIESMKIAGMRANELGHPAVLDPVGVGASTLRTSTANELLKAVKFTVIRGNISEIKTLAVGTGTTKGVDADIADRVTEENLDEAVAFVKRFAGRTGAVIAVTGAIDIVADAKKAYCIYNGHPMMSSITGTGCQLSALTAAFVTANQEHPLEIMSQHLKIYRTVISPQFVSDLYKCAKTAKNNQNDDHTANYGCDQGRHSECMYRGADRSGVNAASDRHSKAAGDRPDPSKWFPDLCQINIRSAAPLSVCILFSCIHAKQCLRIF